MHDTTRAVHVDPAHAERVIGEFLDRAGMPRKDSYLTSEVCDVLTRAGYAVSPGTLAEFTRKKYIAEFAHEWTVVAIYCLCGALEARRRWLPTPSLHDMKKSGARLQIEQLRAEGVNPPIVDPDRHTVEDLLIQMAQNDNRMERECLYEVLRLKLDGYEE